MRKQTTLSRRKVLAGTAALGAGALAAPAIATAAGKTTTWKIQTSWPGGIGLETFKAWCNSIWMENRIVDC